MAKTTLREDYISIDSRDRNRVRDPQANDYTIHFRPSDTTATAHTIYGARYKNIRKIEICNVRYPNTMSVLSEQYLLLEMSPLVGPFDATNTQTQKSIAKLHPGYIVPGNSFIEADVNGIEYIGRFQVESDTIANLDKVRIRFLKYDGTLFTFGTDAALPAALNPVIQNTIDLKITWSEPDTSVIGRQNV